MSALPLGDDELVAVLQWLPQAQRLGSCNLVSTQFRRAVTAATTSISVKAGSVNSSSFQQWLKLHGHTFNRLQVLPSTSALDLIAMYEDDEQKLSQVVNLPLQQLPNLSSPPWGLLSWCQASFGSSYHT
jgi:hypothetical protein